MLLALLAALVTPGAAARAAPDLTATNYAARRTLMTVSMANANWYGDYQSSELGTPSGVTGANNDAAKNGYVGDTHKGGYYAVGPEGTGAPGQN